MYWNNISDIIKVIEDMFNIKVASGFTFAKSEL